LIGKFDGDEYEDIAAYSRSGKVVIFQGNGDGIFSIRRNVAINSTESMIVDMKTFDLNKDGIADLVAAMGVSDYAGREGREIVLLTGTAQGDFEQTLVYTVSDELHIKELIVGDYNGDSYLDLTAVRQPLSYYDNTYGRLILTKLLGNGTGFISIAAENVVWAENIVNYYAFQDAFISFDLDGDGNDDLIKSSEGKVYVYKSNEDGSFRYSNSYNAFDDYWIHSGDFNNDGYQDLVISGWAGKGYVFALFNRGDETFLDRKNIPPELWVAGGGVTVTSADFDGDRRPDLLMTDYMLRGDGALFSTILNGGDDWSQEPFQSKTSIQHDISGEPVGVRIGDLNHDGYPDVVTANIIAGNVAVLLNNHNSNLVSRAFNSVN
jgi:hypothetical protein